MSSVAKLATKNPQTSPPKTGMFTNRGGCNGKGSSMRKLNPDKGLEDTAGQFVSKVYLGDFNQLAENEVCLFETKAVTFQAMNVLRIQVTTHELGALAPTATILAEICDYTCHTR